MTNVAPSPPRSPLDTLPSASNPQLLAHLLEMIARGVRSTRGLEEALSIESRTLRAYLHAARWLGLLSPRSEPVLSAEGLSWVYAGERRQVVYARAIRSQPFLADLLARCGPHAPDAGTIARAIRNADPHLATSTIDRRASAIRSLLIPAMEAETSAEEPEGQLTLPLAQVPQVVPRETAGAETGTAFSPSIYRVILCHLLDHGELTLGHLRALLDHIDAAEAPIGAYVDLALRRGDAVRHRERILITPDAIGRAHLSDSTTSIILSDGGWRDALAELREGRSPRSARGYRLWFRRLLGSEVPPDDRFVPVLEARLAELLEDRSLDAFPIARARDAGVALPRPEPFLQAWTSSGLIVTLPSSLAQLWEGASLVDRKLRVARTRADAVALPSLASRPVAVHGGLLHPGEPLPTSIADTFTLRTRLLTRSPYIAMITAILMMSRLTDHPAQVTRRQGEWLLTRGRHRYGGVLHALDAFARHRGWHPSRLPHAGLSAEVLIGLLTRLEIAVPTDRGVQLEDNLFRQLREPGELREAGRALEAIAGAVDHWLDHLDRQGRSA